MATSCLSPQRVWASATRAPDLLRDLAGRVRHLLSAGAQDAYGVARAVRAWRLDLPARTVTFPATVQPAVRRAWRSLAGDPALPPELRREVVALWGALSLRVAAHRRGAPAQPAGPGRDGLCELCDQMRDALREMAAARDAADAPGRGGKHMMTGGGAPPAPPAAAADDDDDDAYVDAYDDLFALLDEWTEDDAAMTVDDVAANRRERHDAVLDAVRDVLGDDAWELLPHDTEQTLSAESWRQLRAPLDALLHAAAHERAWRAAVLRAGAALRALDDLWAELATLERGLRPPPPLADLVALVEGVARRTWRYDPPARPTFDQAAFLRLMADLSQAPSAGAGDGVHARWRALAGYAASIYSPTQTVPAMQHAPLARLQGALARVDVSMRSRPDALRARRAEVEREAAALRMVRRMVARANVEPFRSVPAGAGGGARGPDDPTIPLERAGQDPVGVGVMVALKLLRVAVLAAAFAIAQRVYVQAHASAVVGQGREAPPPLSRVLLLGLGLDAFVQLLVLLVLIVARTVTAPPPKPPAPKPPAGEKAEGGAGAQVVRAAPVVDDAFLVAYLVEYCASTGLLLALGLLLGGVMDRKRYFGLRDDAVVGSAAYRDILIGVGAAVACVPFHLIL